MTNLKKLGLSALAGSLVATTGYAGALDVTGAAKVSYVSKDETEVTGNPFSMTRDIAISGSGEMDNGMTISYFQLLSAGAFSSSGLTLDMGDAGVLKLSNGTAGGHGISAYEDKMPTAGEQVWDDVDTDDNGVVGTGNANTFGYEVSAMGMTVSASWAKEEQGTDTSMVLVANDLMDGLSVGYGIGSNTISATQEDDHTTLYATYTMGMATVGVQRSKIDKPSADEERDAAAISLAINENMSVSYGVSTVDFETASLSDEESSGVSASYTTGGITIGAVFNATDSVAGSSGTDKEFKEISVAFAF